jgi:Mrp family chromosome partitioning ATPase
MPEPGQASQASDSRRQQDIVIRASLARIKKQYLVMSGKGGVGKSSLAANLAVSLARSGRRIGLLDVDLHGPSIPRLLGLGGRAEAAEDGRIAPLQFGTNLFVLSIDSMLADRDEAVIWRGPRKLNAIRQFISDVAWGPLDVLIIDSPPGTGDEPLAVAQIMPQAQAVVVTTPQELALADVRKSIRFLRKLNQPIAGLIENMSGFVCPHCGRVTDLFGRGGGRLLAESLGLPFLGAVPLDPGVVIASDQGKPYVLEHPESEFSRAVAHIAAAL